MNQTSLGYTYHIEKGDYVNRYQHYENNPISAFIYKSLGIFVFPQLYHIEKGDSYIEPANITGQLIINDLTQSLTSTPILNVVQDTNQVDFGLFKGKHIRISQYTNIDAVVLGEWYIPGTPTPPEPEQPDWFKESIVAWYSPYCKQRMTNFDVIEAYIEDFTKWVYRNSRGTAKITNNTIVITNVVETNNIVEDVNEPYSDLTIRVTGVTENRYLIVRQGRGKPETHIKKDGVYTFKDNNLYFGFGVSVIGECNITITQLPTSILKDYSGNGNHAYLYGGKGKLNSGMGVYQQDFSKLIISRVDKKQDSFSFTVSGSGGSYLAYMQLGNWNNKAFKILANINAKSDYLYLRFRNSTDAVITSVMLKNGENIIPAQNIEGATKAVFEYSLKEGESITITQIPDYPDQLCYDGKMYAIAYGMPILTDYTIIADRTWFKDKINSWSYFADKKKAFTFERTSNGKSFNAMSFAAETAIELQKDGVSYQTKASYNGNAINYHSDQADNDDRLVIGSTKDSLGNQCFIGCHSDILIFNRTLTEYEISWVKNNMMCSKQQEHDIDL